MRELASEEKVKKKIRLKKCKRVLIYYLDEMRNGQPLIVQESSGQ